MNILDFWASMTGVVLPYAGSSSPSGWLLCYGQSLLRSDYPELFANIGTTYGSADGTHFNLPDLRGRVTAGKDNMGGSAANRITNAASGITGTTLGAAGGSETHTLTSAQIPAHIHGQTAIPSSSAGASGSPVMSGTSSGSDAAGSTSANTGGDGAHQNVQPTVILNYIIKT